MQDALFPNTPRFSIDQLNPAQRAAAIYDEGPLLVFAGAGSGKTRVITYRIAHALNSGRVRPHQVVAMTFTNKAAREMQSRITQLLGGQGLRGLTIGTFHSICMRWLRLDGPLFGLRGDFAIYDTSDQKSVIRRALEDLNLDLRDIKPFMSRIDKIKNGGTTLEAMAESGFSLYDRKFPEVYGRYQALLTQSNACDFGDLILKMVELLENNPEAAAYFQNRYAMILVDEYQDTNAIQHRLLRALARPDQTDICAVGDDDQSIYRFRGAQVGNILAFSKHFQDTRVIKLEENYRSTQSILDISNAVIQNNHNREPKKLKAARGAGPKPELHAFRDEQEEAEWMARTILGLQSRGVKLNQIGILFRQNAQSRVIEESLIRARIPLILLGAQRFYERAEIKDALSYLRVVAHPSSDLDFVRAIQSPSRGIGDKTLEKMAAHAAAHKLSLYDLAVNHPDELKSAGLGSAVTVKVRDFADLLKSISQAAETDQPLSVLLTRVLSESGMLRALKDESSFEAEGRLNNLEELVSALEEWSDRREKPNLRTFLEELALQNQDDEEETPQERVVLMTIHASKGLEFKHVLLVGLEEGVFPIEREEMNAEDFEEERRLFYVGVTRAMDQLSLSFCQSRMLYGRRQMMDPSRFIKEIPSELLNSRTTISNYSKNSSNSANLERGNSNAKTWGTKPPSSTHRPANIYTPAPKNPAPLLKKADGSQAPLSKAVTQSPFAPGKKVKHASFGIGQVVALSLDDGRPKAIVDFPTIGKKVIVTQFLETL